MQHAFSRSHPGDRGDRMDRLTECEEDLSRIAADMKGLSSELGDLRAGGEALVALLAERDAVIARHRHAIAALEDERTRLQGQAEAAAVAARTAESAVAERDEQLTQLRGELDRVRANVDDRERRLADAEAALSNAREAAVATERALEVQLAAVGGAEREIADWRRRSQGLLLELADAVSDQVRLETRLASSPLGEARRPGVDGQPDEGSRGHVRLIAQPDGYRLAELEDACPAVGARVELDGLVFVVTRAGRSPLPGDVRRCAFLIPEGKQLV